MYFFNVYNRLTLVFLKKNFYFRQIFNVGQQDYWAVIRHPAWNIFTQVFTISVRVIPLLLKQPLAARAGVHRFAGALVSSPPGYKWQEEKDSQSSLPWPLRHAGARFKRNLSFFLELSFTTFKKRKPSARSGGGEGAEWVKRRRPIRTPSTVSLPPASPSLQERTAASARTILRIQVHTSIDRQCLHQI